MRRFVAPCLATIVFAACSSGGGSTGDGGTSPDGSILSDGAIPDGYTNPPGDGSLGSCSGTDVLYKVGKSHLLVGASMEDATAKSAPFDLRYQYISGGFADGSGPCSSCASGCTAAGKSCANNAGGCAWWGCWQYDQDPPGGYARNFLGTVTGDGQIPMISYYQILQASKVTEGAAEVNTAANDAALMGRYFADWRFLLQQIGQSVVMLHIEPDFWGYAEQVGSDPHAEPAAVASANATDCASEENSIAGMGRCLIAMVRKYAPNALVGLHASAWAAGPDIGTNTDTQLNVATYGQQTAAFLTACGADQADYIVVEASDRDAGYYQSINVSTWWDDTNQKLPSFHQHFAWAKALSEAAGKPLVYWQLPLGNMSLPNQTNAWKDNRVDYFFGHTSELAAAHVVGFAFGAGAGGQTTPESDGGNLVAKVKAYAASGGQSLCP